MVGNVQIFDLRGFCTKTYKDVRNRFSRLLGAFAVVLSLFCGYLTAEDTIPQVIGPFGGLNNTDNSMVIQAGQAQDLLNVDITPGGKSFKKRRGYATVYTLSNATSPVHGTYTFYDSNGSIVELSGNDRNLNGSVNSAAPTVILSTTTFGATWQCTDSQGFAYCVNSSRDLLAKTNGVTYTPLNPTNIGTMVTVTPERLVMAGFVSAPNRIDFSKANDFTTWTIGAQATDPITFTITAPGSKITHIVYAFNRLMWFKNSSFGFIMIGQASAFSDWQVVTVSPNIGTNDNSSIYWNGILYFRGQDSHIYSFDGSNLAKMTRDIQETVTVSQTKTSNSTTLTTKADFDLGTKSNTATDIVDGAVTLSVLGYKYQSDTHQSDFQAGTFNNTSVITTPQDDGILVLSTFTTTGFTAHYESTGTGISSNNSLYPAAQSFTTSSTFSILSYVSWGRSKTGGGCVTTMRIKDDNAGYPGNNLYSATATGDDVSSFIYPNLTLKPITRYWIYIDACGNASNHNNYKFDTETFANGNYQYNGIDYPTKDGGFFTTCIGADIYRDNGDFISRSFDVGFTTDTWLWNWAPFTVNADASGQSLSYYTQSSTDNVHWDAHIIVAADAVPTSIVRRYVRYNAYLSTTDQLVTPRLNGYSMATSAFRKPSGTYQTGTTFIGNDVTSWDAVSISDTLDGGTIQYQFISSTSSTLSPSTSSVITSGQTPTISTGNYVAIFATFTITNATYTPTLNEIVFNWFQGAAFDKAYAFYHKDALWWAVASGNAATKSNKIMRFDLINNLWTLYDIPMNGMYVKNQKLYFGGVSDGKIYEFDNTDSDNGSPINAYWKSKDFFGDSPFTDKEITYISVAASGISNSTATVTYTVNGSSSTSFNFPLMKRSEIFKRVNKNLPAGKVGSIFNIQVGNNAVNQPFEIFGIQVGIRPKPWNVEP